MGRALTRENLLYEDEVDRVKRACKNHYETLLIHGELYTGMRISEFLHLNRRWISWPEGVIRIPERMPCKCGECVKKRGGVWTPKTKDAVRAIPILPEVKELFREFFTHPRKVGDYIGTRNVAYYHVEQIGERAGLNHPIFPHVLRGTFAYMMAKKGLDVFRLKDLMGWATLEPAVWYVKFAGMELKEEVLKVWKQ